MAHDPIDLAKTVLRRKRSDGGTNFDEPVMDPMGGAAMPIVPQADAQESAYDRAMKKVASAVGSVGENVIAPIGRGLSAVGQEYSKNLREHSDSARALADQARRDASGERGWSGRLLSPFESANAMLGTGFAPLSAAASTLGHGATKLTGNPGFGQRVEFASGFLDPSHVGMAKGALLKGAKVAEDVAPYAAMFLPVKRTDPNLPIADTMRAEGRAPEEIRSQTGIHFGPENYFGSYELESPLPDQYGRYQRYGEMPETPQPRPFKEISDEGLTLSRAPEKDIGVTPTSSIQAYDVVHPELLKDFPELQDVIFDVKVHPMYEGHGYYAMMGEDHYQPKVYVRAKDEEQARSIVAHELQHFVSDKGGLEQGSSPESFEKFNIKSEPSLVKFFEQEVSSAQNIVIKAQEEKNAYVEPMLRDHAEFYGIDPNTPNGRLSLDNFRDDLERSWELRLYQSDPAKFEEIARADYINKNIKEPFDMYQHIYGEALARATQDRLLFSAEERAQTPIRFTRPTYGPDGEPTILNSVPENALFSDMQLSKARTSYEDPYYSISQPSMPSMSVAPAGNLNFQASELALKGPEKQTVQSFLDQIKNRPGFTRDSIEELAAKFPDKNAVVTKADFESALPQSKYSKQDLKNANKDAEYDEHLMDEAHDAVMEDLNSVYEEVLKDHYRISPTPENVQAVRNWEAGEITISDLPQELQNAVLRNTPKRMTPETYFSSLTEETTATRIEDTYHQFYEQQYDIVPGQAPKNYQYETYQRLVKSPEKNDNYFEFAITHPDQKQTYKHYPEFESENGNPVSHVRGNFLPEGGEIIVGKKEDPSKPKIFWGNSLYKTKPNSMVIEEIQADIQKVQGKEQTGVTRHSHGVAFKAAIQHAIEGGAKTVYMPTSGPIATVRGKDPKQFKSIYDEQIVKEGINPLREIPGVSVKKVADGAYWEIDFTPEAADYILKGKGQRTPGFKTGGVVQRALDISRFGTDAVQSAVNKARQHRRRPETPRSKQ